MNYEARRLAEEGKSHYDARDCYAATWSYRNAIDAQGRPNAFLEHALAVAYDCDENYDKAIFHYKKSLAIENDSPTRTSLARVYYKKGLCQESLHHALRALQLPDAIYAGGAHTHVRANEITAKCYEKQGKLPEALEHIEQALGLAKRYNHPTADIDRLTTELNRLKSFNRKPAPTPDYGGIISNMYSWESDQRVFWVMYPDDCGRVQRQADGEWGNLDRCNSIQSFYPVNIKESPPDSELTSVNAAEWLDDFAAGMRDDSSYTNVRRDQILTSQGRILEIIRSDFTSSDAASVYAIYVHPDTGATFSIILAYPTTTLWLASYEVDFALRSFTVLR